MKNLIQNLVILAATFFTFNANAQDLFASSVLFEIEAEYMWENFDNEMDNSDSFNEETEIAYMEEVIVTEEVVESMTLIERIKLDTEIEVFPNPAMEDIQISYLIDGTQRLSLRLYDLQGNLVKTFFADELKTSGNHTSLLNIEREEKGNYMLVLNSQTQSTALPFQKN